MNIKTTDEYIELTCRQSDTLAAQRKVHADYPDAVLVGSKVVLRFAYSNSKADILNAQHAQ